MNDVIDANVVKGYYLEIVKGLDVVNCPDGLTGSPTTIFERLGEEDTCYLDETGIIEHEWKSVVDREWFEAWYGDLLQSGRAQTIPIERCDEIEKKMMAKGFPIRGRDIRYVRVCYSIIQKNISEESYLITEDMDFHEPSQKKAPHKTRIKILRAGSGKICKVLRKHNIYVRAICNHP